jgi:predicted metal-dependent hydrolase
MNTNQEVLNSWKEVASYMGRGVRTVQRWEQELGLPVRRPRGKSRSAVIAFKSELDAWLHQAPKELLQENGEEAPAGPALKYSKSERQIRLHGNAELLVNRTRLLVSRSNHLCNQLKVLQEKIGRTAHLTALQVHKTKRGVVSVSETPNLTGPAKAQEKHAIAS